MNFTSLFYPPLLLISLAFILLGCILISYGAYLKRLANARKTWPSTVGRIVSSREVEEEVEVRVNENEDEHASYKRIHYELVYEYVVGGETLRSTPVRFSGGSGSKNILAGCPPGATVEVFYDPQNPACCMLERTPASAGTQF
jgi:hypothetical protein